MFCNLVYQLCKLMLSMGSNPKIVPEVRICDISVPTLGEWCCVDDQLDALFSNWHLQNPNISQNLTQFLAAFEFLIACASQPKYAKNPDSEAKAFLTFSYYKSVAGPRVDITLQTTEPEPLNSCISYFPKNQKVVTDINHHSDAPAMYEDNYQLLSELLGSGGFAMQSVVSGGLSWIHQRPSAVYAYQHCVDEIEVTDDMEVESVYYPLADGMFSVDNVAADWQFARSLRSSKLIDTRPNWQIDSFGPETEIDNHFIYRAYYGRFFLIKMKDKKNE